MIEPLFLCPRCCQSAREYDERPKQDGEEMPLLTITEDSFICRVHGRLERKYVNMITDGHKVIFSA